MTKSETRAAYYAANIEVEKARRAAYYADNRDRLRAYNDRYRAEAKAAALVAYGGEKPACACCGETLPGMLTIDHIGGGGNEHRRSIGGTNRAGANTYIWLRKNGFPEGFRVLCFGCNDAIGAYGACPHTDPTVGNCFIRSGRV
jgi:hypothetical protein